MENAVVVRRSEKERKWRLRKRCETRRVCFRSALMLRSLQFREEARETDGVYTNSQSKGGPSQKR